MYRSVKDPKRIDSKAKTKSNKNQAKLERKLAKMRKK